MHGLCLQLLNHSLRVRSNATFDALQVTDDIERAARMATKSGRQNCLRDSGLYSLTYALHPTLFPFFDPFKGCPQDAMHSEFSSGTANSEAAAMLYILIVKEHWFTVNDLNVAIEKFNWPEGQKPPPIWESVTKGQKNRLPASDANLRYAGAQTMHFALASEALLEPFIRETSHPAWKCWLAHVEYIKLLLADSFTKQTISALDKAVQRHHKLYTTIIPTQ